MPPDLTSAVNLHRWFGFYNPTGVMPTPSSVTGRFLGLLEDPIHSADQARYFLEIAGQALPSMARFFPDLENTGNSIQITTNLGEVGVAASPSGGKILLIPYGKKPNDFLNTLFHTAGSFVSPPEGVEIPPFYIGRTRDSLIRGLTRNYSWSIALSQSFLYQLVLELKTLGLAIGPHILGDTDLTLFEVFRSSGLRGVADVYPNFMGGSNAALLAGQFEGLAAFQLRDTRAQPDLEQPWQEPRRAEKPELARTFLDDDADFRAPFQKGLLSETRDLKPLAAVDKKRVQELLRKTVNTSTLKEDIMTLVSALAPQLAPKILRLLQLDQVYFLVTPNAYGQWTYILTSPAMLLGQAPEEPTAIHVQGRATYAQVLLNVVGNLSRLAMPGEINQRGIAIRSSSRGEARIKEITDALEDANERLEMWGWSGVFEFNHESRLRGLEIPLAERHHHSMREVLKKYGLFVLAEQFYLFSDPRVRTQMRDRFAEVARTITEQLSEKG